MAIWAQPDTFKKAEALYELLQQPLFRHDAGKTLFHLIGDDELLSQIMHADDDQDVRPLVLIRLQFYMENLDCFEIPWEAEAIIVLKQLFYETDDITTDTTNWTRH